MISVTAERVPACGVLLLQATRRWSGGDAVVVQVRLSRRRSPFFFCTIKRDWPAKQTGLLPYRRLRRTRFGVHKCVTSHRNAHAHLLCFAIRRNCVLKPTSHFPKSSIHANLTAVAPIIILYNLCGWIERMPGGTRQNDGLETGLGAAYGRDISVGKSSVIILSSCGSRASGGFWKKDSRFNQDGALASIRPKSAGRFSARREPPSTSRRLSSCVRTVSSRVPHANACR